MNNQEQLTEPREFSCFDDSPENNGWGYNQPNGIEEEPEKDDSDYTGEE